MAPHSLTIQRIANGGYVVFPEFVNTSPHYAEFACNTIDEACAYVKEKIAPSDAPKEHDKVILSGPMPPIQQPLRQPLPDERPRDMPFRETGF